MIVSLARARVKQLPLRMKRMLLLLLLLVESPELLLRQVPTCLSADGLSMIRKNFKQRLGENPNHGKGSAYESQERIHMIRTPRSSD